MLLPQKTRPNQRPPFRQYEEDNPFVQPENGVNYRNPNRRRGGTWIENIYIDDKRLDVYEKLIMLFLHRRAGSDPEHRAWPRQADVAEDLGISERKIRDCLRRLTELEYITSEQIMGGRTIYYVMHQDIADEHLIPVRGKQERET